MKPKKILVCGGCLERIDDTYPHSTILCGKTQMNQPVITKMNWGNHG